MANTTDTYVSTMLASFALACLAVVYLYTGAVSVGESLFLLVYFVGTMTYSADKLHQLNAERAHELRRMGL